MLVLTFLILFGGCSLFGDNGENPDSLLRGIGIA